MKKDQELRGAGGPQLIALTEDPMFDRKVIHDLKAHPSISVGRRNKQNPAENPKIALTATGVQAQHACFETNENGTTLKAMSEAACQFVFINGCKVKDCNPVTLRANDRIIFGI